MLRPSLTDEAICTAIQDDLRHWNADWGERDAWEKEISWSLIADIDALVEPLRRYYTPDRGRPACDPAPLLRAIALMTVREVTSLVDGLRQFHQSPFLARLCGWYHREDIPAINTVYGFLRRN
ncbi:MAG: hypothetical protein M0Z36_02710 [Thermaerobacter sp.]|nr:hypothetical protein [Thermaerobacter sp.]